MKVFRIMRPLGGILQCSKSTELSKTIVKLTLSWYQPGPQGWKAGPYSCIGIFQGVRYIVYIYILYIFCTFFVQIQDVMPISSYDTAGSFLLLGCTNGSIYYIGMYTRLVPQGIFKPFIKVVCFQ